MRSRWDLAAEPIAGSIMMMAVMWLLSGMPVGAATTGTREDPSLSGFTVKLEVQGGPTAFFKEVSGLGSESEVIEQKMAGPTGQTIVTNVPGRLKWREIILKRAVTSDRSFWMWRAQVETGNLKGAILNFVITLHGPSLQPFARWGGNGRLAQQVIDPVNGSYGVYTGASGGRVDDRAFGARADAVT